MSLRWRILGAIVLVIVLTVLLSIGVGYYSTQSRLGVFVAAIGDDEAKKLARNLSVEYTAAGGWETVDRPLSEAGYVYADALQREEAEDNEEDSFELFHSDPIRVVIVGSDGRVVKDNLSELPVGTIAPDLAGQRETVFDLTTNRPVGHVYVDVNHAFLASESHSFLNTLLYITVGGGVLTVGIAALLAAWLSRRITAPVTALTQATQAIAQGETTPLPVTSSDELGQMSAAFNQMTAALARQRDLRKQLLDDVSHELNTPLSVIQLEAKGLQDDLQTPESAADHIIQEVARLRGLVSDLSSLAETVYGELLLTREASSLAELLAAEVGRWQPLAETRQVALSLWVAPDLPDLNLDRLRIGQALGNVLSNAIHCTEAGGQVVMRAEGEGDEAVAIAISDDGIGIPAADLPHVFDRRYRTGRSRRKGIGGTGLGLAITQAIVAAHGGTVSVTSDGSDQGVTVTCRFPLDE